MARVSMKRRISDRNPMRKSVKIYLDILSVIMWKSLNKILDSTM